MDQGRALGTAMSSPTLDSPAVTGNLKPSVAVVAATGSTQANAAALAYDSNAVTGADGTKGVILPAVPTDLPAGTGIAVKVVNTSTTAVLKIYPPTGGVINSIAANSAFALGPDREAIFYSTAALQFYCPGFSAGTATVVEANVLAGVTAGTAIASKAVVADSNIDVTGLRNVSMTGNITVSGTSKIAAGGVNTPASFFGVAAVSQQTTFAAVTTTTAVSVSGAYGFNTAAQADALVTGLNSVRTALRNIGIVA